MASNAPSNGAAAGRAKADAILSKDAAKGAPVHHFDPDASPAEKAAQAGKASDKLKSINSDKVELGKEVPLDLGKSNVVPTISIQDVDKASADERHGPVPPGGLPTGPAPAIPDWYRVGWREVSGIDRPPLEGEEKDKTVLGLFLHEQYYGEWYYNAGIIFFAVLGTHFLTRFHFGWGSLLILLAFCATYYATSMTRVRRNARDDIQRELVKTRLASDSETADWMNHFLTRFWLIYEPVLSKTIVASVDQILSVSTPAFLDSLKLTDFTLGTKAPRVDSVRTFTETADDVVMMDWAFSFTPNDISEMTQRQAAAKVNPKIVLQIRVGKGLATAGMPVLLEDISFSGRMRVRMKLMANFPHVQIVDISFMEKPVIDYVLKPLGGETFGFDIANIPGLSSFIRDMTHATLGPMMYDPNVFTLNLEQLLSGIPLDTAIGVVQVTLHSARGVKGVKLGGGVPDPFVVVNINGRGELARTKYKHNTYNPTWEETKFILINNLTEILNFEVYDYNDHRKNTLLGTTSFELGKLAEDAVHENIESKILKDGKDRGDLRYDVSFYPVVKPEAGENAESLPESSVGIVRITIHQAKDLDHSKSMSGELNPFAKVILGTHSIHSTPKVKHTNNPVWESYKEFLCAERSTSVITIKVIDDRDFLKDPVVGYLSARLDDLLAAKVEAGRDWWPLSGCKAGKVRISTEWKPLNMAGSLHGADQYKPPIGVVRLHLDKATDVKNVEAALGGKSDPYVRVQINNVTKGRTEVINNNLNPVWDQIIYVPVHSLKEVLFLECMDYQHLTKDRSLGSLELRVSELAKANANDPKFPFVSTGKKEAQDPLRLDKNGEYKGHVHYTAQFIPGIALKNGVKFSTGDNAVQKAADRKEGNDDGDFAVDSDEDEEQVVPSGITIGRPVGENNAAPKPEPPTAKVANGDGNATRVSGNGAAPPSSIVAGVEMSNEDLMKEQSGVIIFNIISGQLAKKARLEVLIDDGYWPVFSTVKAQSTNANWEHIGEGFVKELDFGRVWLRLNDASDAEKDNVIAEWKGDAKKFLAETMSERKRYTLIDSENQNTSTVEIESRYVPVPVQLEPRETINNQGTLRIDLVDGREIQGVDRGGKSDPFAVFSLNGQKVFKSQTKKKTLSPEWNENFTVQVPSRVAAQFSVEIFDWNQLEQAKSLGSSNIDLSDIEPFQAAERTIHLTSAKHGNKGEIRIRMMFTPEVIAKTRKHTSTFSQAGKAMTNIGHIPGNAGKGVIGVFKKEKDFVKGGSKEEEINHVPDVAAGQASQPTGMSDSIASVGKTSIDGNSSSVASSISQGTLKVTILSAKDLSVGDVKPYVVVRVGDKEHKTKHSRTAAPEWNEVFQFSASQLTPKLFIQIYDHKTLGKDKQLGEAEIDIWRHINPGSVPAADVTAELREGQGILRLRLEFGATPTNSSIYEHQNTHSRFSLRHRRSQDLGKE